MKYFFEYATFLGMADMPHIILGMADIPDIFFFFFWLTIDAGAQPM